MEINFTGVKDIAFKPAHPVFKNNTPTFHHDLNEVINDLELHDGMVISFHHHLRNGDYVVDRVLRAIKNKSVKNLTVFISSIFECHSIMVELIEQEIITNIITAYASGSVARAISEGKLKNPAYFHSHGARARLIEQEEVVIDYAFVASPSVDHQGNLSGSHGKSACGVLGYAIADCMYAKNVIVISDNLVDHLDDIEVSGNNINKAVLIDSIGNPSGIVSGTTQITKDPVGLIIANNTCQVIEGSGLLKNGFSFQTGAGGISLAVADQLKHLMQEKKIVGSFASGGITSYLVEMLELGLFEKLYDVQCFDLGAIESLKRNKNHIKMSASKYANPYNQENIVQDLDVVILGATEIDLDFNVNVLTGSNGMIMGGSGGHSDTAAGAKCSIIVSKLISSRLSVVVDRCTTITTPGETVDILVTEYGVAINPLRQDLIEKLNQVKGLKLKTIEELYEIALKLCGKPAPLQFSNQVVAQVEYRDGTIIDQVKALKK